MQVRLGNRPGGLLLNKTYTSDDLAPGPAVSRTVREVLPCPATRAEGVLTVSMLNEHGQYFEDAITVAFNMEILDMLKWAALVPFAATIAAVALASTANGAVLPS